LAAPSFKRAGVARPRVGDAPNTNMHQHMGQCTARPLLGAPGRAGGRVCDPESQRARRPPLRGVLGVLACPGAYLLLLGMLPLALEEAGVCVDPQAPFPHRPHGSARAAARRARACSVRTLSRCARRGPGLAVCQSDCPVLRAAAAASGPPNSKCAAFASGLGWNAAWQRRDPACSRIRGRGEHAPPRSLRALELPQRPARIARRLSDDSASDPATADGNRTSRVYAYISRRLGWEQVDKASDATADPSASARRQREDLPAAVSARKPSADSGDRDQENEQQAGRAEGGRLSRVKQKVLSVSSAAFALGNGSAAWLRGSRWGSTGSSRTNTSVEASPSAETASAASEAPSRLDAGEEGPDLRTGETRQVIADTVPAQFRGVSDRTSRAAAGGRAWLNTGVRERGKERARERVRALEKSASPELPNPSSSSSSSSSSASTAAAAAAAAAVSASTSAARAPASPLSL